MVTGRHTAYYLLCGILNDRNILSTYVESRHSTSALLRNQGTRDKFQCGTNNSMTPGNSDDRSRIQQHIDLLIHVDNGTLDELLCPAMWRPFRVGVVHESSAWGLSYVVDVRTLWFWNACAEFRSPQIFLGKTRSLSQAALWWETLRCLQISRAI